MPETKVRARQVIGNWPLGGETLEEKIATMDEAIASAGGSGEGSHWNTSGPNIFRPTGRVVVGGDADPATWLAFGETPTPAAAGFQAKKGGFFRKTPETGTDSVDTALFAYRETVGVTGGTPGFVNVAAGVQTVTGPANTSFEWNFLARLDNFANSGENCGAYLLAYKRAQGSTFGTVIDAREFGAPSGGQLVGLELDIYTEGAKANAVGIDLIHRHSTIAGGASAIGWGLRISADPTSQFDVAAEIAHGKTACLKLTGHHTRSVKGAALEGPFQVGFDTAGADLTNAAYRMDRDHFIAFENTSQRRLTYGTVNVAMGDGWKFTVGPNSADIRWAVNENGATEQLGVLRIAGQQVLAARRPWSGAWTNIQGTWRTSPFDMSTITDALINGNTVATSVRPLWQILGCLIEDLKAHGVIG